MNLITHAILGLAISEAFMLTPITVLLGSIIPDFDYVIGLEHRTITHSLLFAAISFLIIYKWKGKKTSYSFLLGLISHYMLDSITPMGIPLFYPIDVNFSFNLVNWDDMIANIGLILASVIVILNKKNIHEFLTTRKRGEALKCINAIMLVWLGLLLAFPVSTCAGDLEKIGTLMIMPGETKLKLNGTICSDIRVENSSSGNTYQIFTMCDDTGNITVWKGEWILENNLSKGDIITLCGKFTRKFSQPEIYYITSVNKQ